MVADPTDPERSMWQAFTGQSGHAWSEHYDDLQPRWMAGQMQPMAGEGPWETLTLSPESPPRCPPAATRSSSPTTSRASCSTRSGSSSSARFGPRGWPHSMPMWFTVRDGEIWVWTYAKSQKVKNLERDPRATLLVETGRRVHRAARA